MGPGSGREDVGTEGSGSLREDVDSKPGCVTNLWDNILGDDFHL